MNKRNTMIYQKARKNCTIFLQKINKTKTEKEKYYA